MNTTTTIIDDILFGFLTGFIFYFIFDISNNAFILGIMKIKQKKYHIYNWIIFSLLLFCMIYYIFFNEITTTLSCFMGICLGSTLQCLTYIGAM